MQLVMHIPKTYYGDVQDLLQHPALMYKDPRTGQWEQRWTGKQLVSLLLPPNFNLTKYVRDGNPDTEGKYDKERLVVIHNGELLAGSLCKKTVGNTGGGIVQQLCNDYSHKHAANFLNNMQKMVNYWLMGYGFSARLSDCMISKKTEDVIDTIQRQAFQMVEKVEMNPILPSSVVEDYAQKVFASVRDRAGDAVANDMTLFNGFNDMSDAGSKGSGVNISQICGVVGQQSVNGERIGVKYDKRLLSYFPQGNKSLHPINKGFVPHSFIQGLTPLEFFFHAMGGREGLVDTSVKSVSRDTKILIIDSGEWKTIYIGDWIDQLMTSNQHDIQKEGQVETLELSNPVSIPTVDEDGRTFYASLTSVTRHPPGSLLYKIVTEHNRDVVVTASHSLLVYDHKRHKIQQRRPADVTIGDLLPVFHEDSNQCSFDKVSQIQSFPPDQVLHKYMYDVTVPSTLNFAIANGLLLRDTAETVGLNRMLLLD